MKRAFNSCPKHTWLHIEAAVFCVFASQGMYEFMTGFGNQAKMYACMPGYFLGKTTERTLVFVLRRELRLVVHDCSLLCAPATLQRLVQNRVLVVGSGGIVQLKRGPLSLVCTYVSFASEDSSQKKS